MEPWRTILLVLTVLGFLVTVGGLVAAFAAAVRERREAGERITRMRELADAEQAERSTLKEPDDLDERSAELHARYEGLYADQGFVRPSYDNLVYLAQHESQRLLGMVLDETRRDFIIAGVGLLVSTIASIGSLYL